MKEPEPSRVEVGYAARTPQPGPPETDVRTVATVVVKLVGLGILVWGAWGMLHAVVNELDVLLIDDQPLRYFRRPRFWKSLFVQPIDSGAAALVVGFMLLRFGDTFSAWVMPRR